MGDNGDQSNPSDSTDSSKSLAPPQVLQASPIDPMIQKLQTELAELAKKIEKPPKDVWDKLTAVSAILSGLLVAAIGFYATNVYNQSQQRAEQQRKDQELLVAEVQTVEKFIPHLASKDEAVKSASLIAISALGNGELAVKLAKAFAGPGATSALTTIAATASNDAATDARKALVDVFGYLKPRVLILRATMYEGQESMGTGFLVSNDGLILTAAHNVNGIRPESLVLQLPDGTAVGAHVVKIDHASDLAVVQIPDGKWMNNSPALKPSDPTLGLHVAALVLNGPDNHLVLESGTVITVDAAIETSTILRGVATLDFDSFPGSSGSPVIDGEGRLVGMIIARTGASTIIVPGKRALELVDASR